MQWMACCMSRSASMGTWLCRWMWEGLPCACLLCKGTDLRVLGQRATSGLWARREQLRVRQYAHDPAVAYP
jgi:hypothetical protein